jgi:hypothetical protein
MLARIIALMKRFYQLQITPPLEVSSCKNSNSFVRNFVNPLDQILIEECICCFHWFCLTYEGYWGVAMGIMEHLAASE